MNLKLRIASNLPVDTSEIEKFLKWPAYSFYHKWAILFLPARRPFLFFKSACCFPYFPVELVKIVFAYLFYPWFAKSGK